MPTGYEVDMYRHIHQIAQSLNRIANCMEAEEKRKRRMETGGWAPVKNQEDFFLRGECSKIITGADGKPTGCNNPVIAVIDGRNYCEDHIEVGFSQIGAAIKAAKAGFQYLEDAVQNYQYLEDAALKEAVDGGDHPA